MTVAIDAAARPASRRTFLVPRNAVIITAFDAVMFTAFGIAYLSPLTPAIVWHDAGGAVTAASVLPFATLAAFGGLIAARRSDNLVGWVILGAATAFGLGACCSLASTLLLYHGNLAGRWVQFGGVLWGGFASPAFLGYVLALLLFPEGRLPSRRWRWVVYAQLALVVVSVFAEVVSAGSGGGGITYVPVRGVDQSNPLGIPALAGVSDALINASTPAELVLLVLAILSVFLRLRGAEAERRQQIKWFAVGAVVLVVGFALTGVLGSPVDLGGFLFALYVLFSVVAVMSVPVAVAVAVLRYRLYDIDVIINRTLVYGSLAVFITAIYVGIAVGIGAFVGSGGKPNLGLSILATAIVAVGFQPARERLQRVANRLVYGKRATPYQVLSEFSSHVAESYAADEVLPRMARVLQAGTTAETATVWLRSGGALRAAAVWPPPAGAAPLVELPPAVPLPDGMLPDIPDVSRAVEVRHQGDLLGALSVVKRRGESLTPVEEKLLDDLAHQAGLVLKNVGLTADLQTRLEELRASRQRLVSAQDAERRRLERNLHDGAQQHLVALKVKLGLAEMLASKDPERARQTLQQLKTDTDEALDTLRDLARGIYPPLLAEKGLPTSLESQARKATVPVTVDADGVGRYSQEIEATVYFCVLEALQNVQKYAAAKHVRVLVREEDGALTFDVTDDGVGFDAHTVGRGTGLTNMQDRLDALDGAVQIESTPGHGTRVSGVIPLRQPVTVAG